MTDDLIWPDPVSNSCSIHALIAVCNVQEEIFLVMFLQHAHVIYVHLIYAEFFSTIFCQSFVYDSAAKWTEQYFISNVKQNMAPDHDYYAEILTYLAFFCPVYFISVLVNEKQHNSYLKNRQVYNLYTRYLCRVDHVGPVETLSVRFT